eukprot:TRINITY_DN28526_c0_g1_i1.p1 TRINITY_DN28526_c0_g1~~TRINITY_DN28526_c0_g1_i1.p1  ORF type:complete len:690 (+),score=196.34 TRINITY_DN28526_c0_g1_i1:80-2149(+)
MVFSRLVLSCGFLAVVAWHGVAQKVIATLDAGEALQGLKTDLLDGEDAAILAQRVTEERRIYDPEIVLAVAKSFAEGLQDVEYKPPKDLVLRTGGAYSRRADDAIKERRFPAAVADCLRAMMRPGLDSTAADVFMKKLGHALLRMERIREMEQQEAAGDEKLAEQQAEADALAKEWKVLLAEDEALWKEVEEKSLLAALADGGAERTEVLSMSLNLNSASKDKGAEKTGTKKTLALFDGDDESHAAVSFCAANGIHSPDEVLKLHGSLQSQAKQKSYKAPAHLALESAAAHLERGESHEADLNLAAAGADYARALLATKDAEEKEHLSGKLQRVLAAYGPSQSFAASWGAKDCKAVLDAAVSIPADMRSENTLLMIARCYVREEKLKEAIATLTSLINKCDKSGSWLTTEPRVVGSVLGAELALRVGDIDKAKKFYQLVLRADPDQHFVNKRYKSLRIYMRMLTDIEEMVKGSKNHDVVKAVKIAQSILEHVLGKQGASAAGTRLLLFECKSKSAMTLHDDSIEACNTAIKQFENHDNPDPRRIAEAYAWRAEANMRDKSYDDAVADLQVALKKVPNSEDYKEQFEQAKRQQNEWNKSEEQHDPRTREKMGHFYINRPNKEILDLPDNVDELDQEARCKWLKTGFRKMSLRWHPDKAKGGKARAQRKSAELGEAKGLLELQWGCKGRRR